MKQVCVSGRELLCPLLLVRGWSLVLEGNSWLLCAKVRFCSASFAACRIVNVSSEAYADAHNVVLPAGFTNYPSVTEIDVGRGGPAQFIANSFRVPHGLHTA